MNAQCANCNKTVYPLEKLNCLDKIWHKGCFRCTVCNMVLNMKTYKGYNKQPYCNAHYPQTKFTAIADTPESIRLAANTKNQSAVKYHEEFEKSRGKFTPVADDPETLRHKAQGKIVSNVAYHGNLQKKAEMEQLRPTGKESTNGVGSGSKVSPTGMSTSLKSEQIVVHTSVKPVDPVHEAKDSPYSSSKLSTLIYSSEHGAVNQPSERRIGSIADYDPMSEYSNKDESLTGFIADPYERPSNDKFCRAVYDYVAADDDEISFIEGDIIKNCERIDEGWMSGTVERTGESGMLPANYVEFFG